MYVCALGADISSQGLLSKMHCDLNRVLLNSLHSKSREHADTTVVLEALCRRASRRRGQADWRAVLALARRVARMLRQCFLVPRAEALPG